MSSFVLRARQQMPFAALTGAGLNSDAGRFFWTAHVAAASLERNASSLHSAELYDQRASCRVSSDSSCSGERAEGREAKSKTPINLCLFSKTPSSPSQGRGSRRLDTGASLARALSFLPPSFLLHSGRRQPDSLAAAARVCTPDDDDWTDQHSPLSPVNPNTQIKTMSASLDTTTAQVPASPAPSPADSLPTISPESASKSQLAAQAVAPQSAAVDHILLTPRLEAILESYSKDGQGDAELLKLLLQAKAKEDEVSLSILALSCPLPHGREPGKLVPRVL